MPGRRKKAEKNRSKKGKSAQIWTEME